MYYILSLNNQQINYYRRFSISKKILLSFLPMLDDKNYLTLLAGQRELTNYLHYIRQKKKVINITIEPLHSSQKAKNKQTSGSTHVKVTQNQVVGFVHLYVKMLKEINCLDSYIGKKLYKNILNYLQQFPSLHFLYQTTTTFGKVQKKLSLNQQFILTYSNDDMVPLFKKIIQKIQSFKKQSQNKKLIQLGHRIKHLQDIVQQSKNNFQNFDPQIQRIFRKYQTNRVEKYLVMQDVITKAEKKFGNFSEEFVVNREVFGNLNRVYEDIKKHEKEINFV